MHNFNIKDAVLISHSEQKNSDHEEAGTATALRLVKAKDRYFSFNGVWFSLVISCYDCLVSTDSDKIVSIKEIYQNLWKKN